MQIKSMTATFGKLKNARLDLGPGLNVIQAPNEGGKSTWCAFLRAMLYGIPTRERDTKTAIAEKNRYQPWAGGSMEGSVDLVWQGKEITIRRGPKGSTPFGAFSAVYTGTGEAVPGLTAQSCGEELLGVSREVFERSAFVGQGGAAIGESAELEKRIAALVSSGEEDVSYSQAEGRLREWQRRRRFNRSGAIHRLENELAVLDDTLARQSQAVGQAEEARRQIEALTARRDALSAALAAWRSRENRERMERYEAAQSGLAAARAAVDALNAELHKHGAPPDKEALRRGQEELAYLKTVIANQKLAEGQVEAAEEEARAARLRAEDPLFPNMTADEAWRQAGADSARAAECRSLAGQAGRRVWLGAAAGLVLGGAAAAGGWFLLPAWRLACLGAGAALLLLSILIAALACRGRGKKLEGEAAALLARYGAAYPEDIMDKASDYREKCVAAQEAERKAQAVRDACTDLARQREELTQGLLELVHSFEPAVTDAFGISAALSRALGLQEQLATARVRLEGAEQLAGSLPRPEALPVSVPQSEEAQAGEAVEEDAVAAAAELAAVEGELSRLHSAQAMALGELNTLGDPVLFEARRGELREELDARREEYESLSLALEALEGANADLQARFSPALNQRAGELLSALTGGRYAAVTLTREFDALAREADSPLPRRTLALSQGTAEQVYLAARLAVCELALPGGDPAPLVLDDVLDAFDDGRTALALDALRAVAGRRQVLLFTCHSREGRLLSGREDVRVLSLQSDGK